MTQYALTKEELKKEIIKCGKDPKYFLFNYAKITHPVKGVIPFSLYPFQESALDDFIDYRFNVILKARQLGLSTVTAGYIAWLMIFNKEKSVLIMATKLESAKNLLDKVKSIYAALPAWLKITNITTDNKTSFTFSNGSKVKATTTSGDAGRSEALSLLVLDEAAHIEDLDDLWTGLSPTISTGGRCIAISTPKGTGNWFHKTYTDAEMSLNEFHPIRLMWNIHPDRDQEWFEKETRNMSRRQIAQEYLCSFLASGETVIHTDVVEAMEKSARPPKSKLNFDKNLWIWENFVPNHTYAIAADVARGDGSDSSAFHLLDINAMEVVGEYNGKLTTTEFASLLDATGREYGNALVVVENNNLGISVLERLIEMQYPNIFYSIKNSGDYIDQLEAQYTSNSVPGFTTTSRSRPLIIAKLEEYLRNNMIKVNSVRLVNELKTFVWFNGKAQATRGYHDDLTMSLGILCWIKDVAFNINMIELEYKKAIISGVTSTGRTLDTTIEGMLGHRRSKYTRENIYNIENAVNYGWLLKG